MPRVTITVPGKSPQPYRFQLDRNAVSLGRGSNNDIVIDCGSVSVSHAVMRRVEGGFELADLQSTNGIKLDGERRELVSLHNGISLKMGDVTFDFLLTSEELEALESENAAPKLPPLPEPEPVSAAETSSGQKHKNQQPAHQPSSGGLIWLLILILIAFCVGMAIRFNKETGGNWFKAVISREAPAATDGGK
jgi:pSer/pThr/pTyr-binding forkhead associated (FHA) protein